MGACVPRGGHTNETNGYLSMRSRMFRISRSRLGAHTSLMGDISPNCFQLDALRCVRRLGRAKGRPGGVTHQPGTCAMSHVMLDASLDSRWQRGCAQTHMYVIWDTIRLYVYLTHQTGTYGSTMRNMRSTSSRGTYSRVTRYYSSSTHYPPLTGKQIATSETELVL